MKQEENPIPAGGNAASTSPKTESANQTAKQPAAQAKKTSGFQLILRQIGLALLFLVIGMLAILLALYLPASGQLKKAQTELERLVPIETQYLELQASYSNQQAQSLVYKIMSNTSQLKEALAEADARMKGKSNLPASLVFELCLGEILEAQAEPAGAGIG